MEFYDEDARPRFLLHSKASQQPTRSDPEPTPLFRKPTLLISLSLSTLFFTLAFSYITSEPYNSLLVWISISFLLGPFAPLSLTAGDIRVGLGPPLEEPVKEIEQSGEFTKKNSKKASKANRKAEETNFGSDISGSGQKGSALESWNGTAAANGHGPSVKVVKKEEIGLNEEANWTDEDDELLKKLMGRHPVGKPGRWEAIAGGFKGRHTVESVIKRSKAMGEKKVSDDDSYKKFLKDRKPVDRRIEEGNESNVGEIESTEGKGENFGWSSGEDLALLNALKAFPKDVPMRWEKIAAAVPGKTKAACMKRVTDLKRDFRSSKAAGTLA